MNLNIDFSKIMIPALGVGCVVGAILVASGLRTPAVPEAAKTPPSPKTQLPESLELNEYIPTMEEVVAKHLFVPERVATGENAFPDLLVKGVYVGTERNVLFSLKSRPDANMRVWQGDEESAISQVEDKRDPRKPIADFLSEWEIKSIDFSGVTVEHLITGETETYLVDYKPAKHVKDSAQNGYGQGMLATATSGAKSSTAKPPPSSRPRPPSTSTSATKAVASRVGAYMKRMSPQQRQQFMKQLHQQNVSANKRPSDSQKKSNKSDSKKKR